MLKTQSNHAELKRLKKRKAREFRFRAAGISALAIAVLFLATLLINIAITGYHAFQEAYIQVEVTLDEDLVAANKHRKIIQNALAETFPNAATDRRSRRDLGNMLSRDARYLLRDYTAAHPDHIGTTQTLWLPASDDVSQHIKYPPKDASLKGRLSDNQKAWLTQLQDNAQVRTQFNTMFFSRGDSREPESAGILVSLIGSALSIVVCIALALPVGVATAIYLQEFAPKNKLTDFIEININNLAAVPSIIFGLLGLAIFLNFFGVPRSSSLAGGMVLALMILPVIVIASRNALRTVPQSMKDAAKALGATRMQVVFHHTLVYALPGIMTGVILSIARAFGETAPLIMIGMVAFVADAPRGFTDAATTMPVQVFLWSNNPELGFVEKTSAAILILLGLMIMLNGLAIYIRKKFEIKWV